MTTDAAIDAVFHGKQRTAVRALARIYGDDIDKLLNELHAIAARLAIASGVTPESFAAGIKHHWDFIANALNQESPPQ